MGIRLEKLMDLDEAVAYMGDAAPSTVVVNLSYLSPSKNGRKWRRKSAPVSTLQRDRARPADQRRHCPPDDTELSFVKLRVYESWKDGDERNGKATDVRTDGLTFGKLMDALEAGWKFRSYDDAADGDG